MMALLSLPAPSSSHWGVCSEKPGCKKGTLSVCVCMNAQVHAFRRGSSPPCFPSISTQCKAKLQKQAAWDGGCVQNWPNLVFSLVSLKVKNWERGSLSFSPLQTKPEPERWGKPMCCAYQRQCVPRDEAGLVGMGMLWLLPFLLPTHALTCSIAWPLPGCRSSQHL